MRKLLAVALILLLAGCFEKPPVPSATPIACTAEAKLCPDGSFVGRVAPSCEFAPCPSPSPTPAPSVTPSPTPKPDFESMEVGELIERGDFVVTLDSVGLYTHVDPAGQSVVDYRVDLQLKNRAAVGREYRFGYSLTSNGEPLPMRWYSTLYSQGFVEPGQEISGSLYFDTHGSNGPFEFLVKTLSLTEWDYTDVVGPNKLATPVAGTRMYSDVCAESARCDEFLGTLSSSQQCTGISAARDWFNYPSWVEDHVIVTRLKLKNSGDCGVNLFVVDTVPQSLNVTARDLAYTYPPVFLDDYHPAWFVHLGRNEIWINEMNYSVYMDEVQVQRFTPPEVAAVNA